MTEGSRAAEFLGLFNEVEQHLRSSLGRADHESFSSLASAYAERTRLPRSVLRDLGTFAELRNVISHQRYYDGRPIADPAPGVLEHLGQVRDLLLRPPTVLSVLAGRAVVSVRADDPVRAVLHQVRTLDYSQFPVYDDAGWAGLVTTNAIARWFARQVDDDEVTTGEEPVAAVLACAEDQDAALHVPRTTTAAEAIELLGRPLAHGPRPRALVVTDSGREGQAPLGVVVDEDLSALHRALDVPAAPGRRR
ncbi:CBS domain-containing protein [Modestobacter versicolor]|uniref:CBS domain-containing protein n=1 Tax=Modestobacter versicolor TaxID=429133 RepID=A0A323V6X2_9ACTN|nr:CBS domain-containing protein [Modestobacter versicolor]MBB3677327.1 CBS domain-containing protein [Modestobacter versicolor]PZA20512.1 hypothetical protein DMO24_15065 [Modestobacter versicolor]